MVTCPTSAGLSQSAGSSAVDRRLGTQSQATCKPCAAPHALPAAAGQPTIIGHVHSSLPSMSQTRAVSCLLPRTRRFNPRRS
eukprot:356016-Chlamydomonas_euryale.AAC.2